MGGRQKGAFCALLRRLHGISVMLLPREHSEISADQSGVGSAPRFRLRCHFRSFPCRKAVLLHDDADVELDELLRPPPLQTAKPTSCPPDSVDKSRNQKLFDVLPTWEHIGVHLIAVKRGVQTRLRLHRIASELSETDLDVAKY